MADIKLSEAKELCTAAELQLYQASVGKALNALPAAQLKRKIVRSRNLRDKWRDQATRQRRDAQQAKGGRGVSDETRSTRKAELFQEVLNRFEARLEKVEATAAKAASKPVKKKTPKSVRTESHRQTRAAVRNQLSEKREQMELDATKSASSPKRSTTKKKTTKPATEAKAADSTQASTDDNGAATTAVKTKAATRKKATAPSTPRGLPKAEQAASHLNTNPKDQLSAEAAAKEQRVKTSGLTTRTRGHISARGKRDQAARNTRKRT